MGTFYKGNNILNDPTLEHYIKGERKLQGVYVKITDPINKYNKDFIAQVNDLNANFYRLVRANKIAIELIHKYHSGATEAHNLMNLIISQSGTIRFNRVLKGALTRYGIKQQNIYNSIKNDISKQYDRLKRNSKLIDMLMNDFGLTPLLKAIKEETDLDFVEYINSLEDTCPLEKPLFIGEDKDAIEDKWYDDLGKYQVGKIVEFIEKHNINISGDISDSLEQHREHLKAQKQEQKEEKIELGRRELLEKAYNLIHDNCAHIQRDIKAGYNQKHIELTADESYLLFKKIQAMTKVCHTSVVFYIALVAIGKRSIGKVQYARYPISNGQTIVSSASKMGLIEDAKKAQEACNRIKMLRPEYVAKVQRIIFDSSSIYENDTNEKYEYKDFYMEDDFYENGKISVGLVKSFNGWLENKQRELNREKREKQRIQRELKQSHRGRRDRSDGPVVSIKSLEQERIRRIEERLANEILRQKNEALDKMNDPSSLIKFMQDINTTSDDRVLNALYKVIDDDMQAYVITCISEVDGKCKSYGPNGINLNINPFINLDIEEYGWDGYEDDPAREYIKGARYFISRYDRKTCYEPAPTYRILLNKDTADKILGMFTEEEKRTMQIKVSNVSIENTILKEWVEYRTEQENTFESKLHSLIQDNNSQLSKSFNICKEKGIEEVYCILFLGHLQTEYYDARLKKKRFKDRGSLNIDDVSLYPELARAKFEVCDIERSLGRNNKEKIVEILKVKVI